MPTRHSIITSFFFLLLPRAPDRKGEKGEEKKKKPRVKKVKTGEQHAALSLKRDDGHRPREYARGNAWFLIAFIERCVFLEIR